MHITFIQTGGTIDKDYPHSSKGWAFEFGEPATHRILERLEPSFDYEVITACQKDSLEINDEDRQGMVDLILEEDCNPVILTHGTDSMLATAGYLAERLPDRLIILTGAMRPERFSNSEAPINLGAAIATANLCEVGVYVAMHGIVKQHSEMQRDPETGKYH